MTDWRFTLFGDDVIPHLWPRVPESELIEFYGELRPVEPEDIDAICEKRLRKLAALPDSEDLDRHIRAERLVFNSSFERAKEARSIVTCLEELRRFFEQESADKILEQSAYHSYSNVELASARGWTQRMGRFEGVQIPYTTGFDPDRSAVPELSDFFYETYGSHETVVLLQFDPSWSDVFNHVNRKLEIYSGELKQHETLQDESLFNWQLLENVAASMNGKSMMSRFRLEDGSGVDIDSRSTRERDQKYARSRPQSRAYCLHFFAYLDTLLAHQKLRIDNHTAEEMVSDLKSIGVQIPDSAHSNIKKYLGRPTGDLTQTLDSIKKHLFNTGLTESEKRKIDKTTQSCRRLFDLKSRETR